MQTHAEIGARIMGDDRSSLLQLAAIIARGHHERWDGGGYPQGLAGEAIPLAARIVAIADVFDALTSVRPYKRAWSLDETVDYIRKERGRHFDPLLVDKLAQVLAEFDRIKTYYADQAEGHA